MILVLNSGSQSIKWALFDKSLNCLERGEVNSFNKLNLNKDIKIIGHRVVHGGNEFEKPVLITNNIIKKLEKLNKLAPLHNPKNLAGIKYFRKKTPQTKQVAIFDTEFYQGLPEKAKTYALPEKILKKHGFKKFGFHGISHEYAAKKTAKLLKKPLSKINLVTCHLGGGSSITAIKKGKAIDTSMGYTPLAGVAMMTRPGDLDPGIVLELCKNYKYDTINNMLNQESGLKAICGYDKMLDILKDKKAKPALDYYTYQIQKYIGAYTSILSKCDALVFTGTIGYGSARIRNNIGKIFNFKKIAIKPNEELAMAEKIWQKF